MKKASYSKAFFVLSSVREMGMHFSEAMKWYKMSTFLFHDGMDDRIFAIRFADAFSCFGRSAGDDRFFLFYVVDFDFGDISFRAAAHEGTSTDFRSETMKGKHATFLSSFSLYQINLLCTYQTFRPLKCAAFSPGFPRKSRDGGTRQFFRFPLHLKFLLLVGDKCADLFSRRRRDFFPKRAARSFG